MSWFTAAILLTIGFWALIALVAYVCYRVGRRIFFNVRRHPRILKWVAWPIFGFVVIGLSVGEGPLGTTAVILALILCIPFMLLALMQAAFWGYHWLKHGDPFFEPATEGEGFVSAGGREKRESKRKFCPICMRNTNCRVTRSLQGYFVHVQKN